MPRAHLAAGILLGALGLIAALTAASSKVGPSAAEGGIESTGSDPITGPRVRELGSSGLHTPRARSAEPEIRVRIRKGVDGVEITAPPVISARYDGRGGGEIPLRTPVRVTSGAQGIELRDAAGQPHTFGRGRTVRVVGTSRGITIDGVAHPGLLLLQPRERELNVVEVMPIETYLPGVLAKELYADWPLETFRAQAVAARTYAMHERSRARSSGRSYDVESTTLDQAYDGLTKNTRALDGVRQTRGWVIGDGGDLLRAYYSSTCGGRQASAAEVWPTTNGFEFNLAGPLQATNRRAWYCQTSPLYRWEVRRPVDALSRRIRAWGKSAGHPVRNLGELRSVSVVELNEVDRPQVYELTDHKGKRYRLKGEELRVACNTSVRGLPSIKSKTRVNSGDVTMEFRRGTVTIEGRGFGHGVGLCQFCARGMGSSGIGWRDMIAAFYPGSSLERRW